MTPGEMVQASMEVAEEGMAKGELPIGAMVVAGDAVVARAYTMDSEGRLKHADLLAMIEADGRRVKDLRLAVSGPSRLGVPVGSFHLLWVAHAVA